MANVDVAIVCQEGLQLEALLEKWADSRLSEFSIHLLIATASVESQSAFYKGRPLPFHAIEDFDFSSMQMVIVLETEVVVEAYQALLSNLSCPVLGFMSDLLPLQPKPFMGELSEGDGIIGLANPAVLALKRVLSGLECDSVDVTALYPVSIYGKEGVTELATQTTKLLNVQALEPKVFDTQMPFNYFPMASSHSGERLEQVLSSQLVKAFSTDDVHVTAVQMPVFHGIGLCVSVVLSEKADADLLLNQWHQEELFVVRDGAKNLSNYDLLQLEGQLLLGNLKRSKSDDYRLDFWLGFDEYKFGVGQNIIMAAEFLLKHHL